MTEQVVDAADITPAGLHATDETTAGARRLMLVDWELLPSVAVTVAL